MTALLLAFILTAAAQDPAPAAPAPADPTADPAPVTDPAPPEPVILTAASYTPPDQGTGSLWNDVHARQLMGLDGNARQIGDLVTVHIYEAQVTTLDASTSTARDSSTDLGVEALLGAETSITEALPNMGGKVRVAGSSKNNFDGTGSTSRSAELAATVTCEVKEVLPNGNLRVEGFKTLRVNNETQYLTVSGVARPRDIQMDNTITSDLLASGTIQLTGSGVVADKQRPGLLARLADRIWPF